jgi:hypothetical protein
MNANVNKGYGGSDRCSRDDKRRPGQFREVDEGLWNVSATESGRDRMAARIAGFGLPHRVVVVCRRVVVQLGWC